MYEHDFCEYAVKKKCSGRYLALLVCVSVAMLAFIVCFFLLILPAAGLFIGAIVLTLFGTLVWYLSRFSSIEYEYTQTAGIFDAASVYSKQYRKERVSVDLKKSARLVAPYKNGRIEGGYSPRRIHDLRSSPDAANAYIIVYETEDGTEALLFDATARMIENIRHQVPSVTVLADGLPEE